MPETILFAVVIVPADDLESLGADGVAPDRTARLIDNACASLRTILKRAAGHGQLPRSWGKLTIEQAAELVVRATSP